jgi:pimeloyl-ACP methyl ester carboxylesterase
VVPEAPFTSAVDVGAQHYWFVPVRRFMKDQFRSDLHASKLAAPVLVVHGENDAVVPITLGKRLYGLIRAPKQCGHNDLGARAVAAAKLFITGDRHPMAGRTTTG